MPHYCTVGVTGVERTNDPDVAVTVMVEFPDAVPPPPLPLLLPHDAEMKIAANNRQHSNQAISFFLCWRGKPKPILNTLSPANGRAQA